MTKRPDTAKKPIPYRFLLPLLFCPALFNCLLLILSDFITSAPLYSVVYYVCRLLSLFVLMAGAGAALFYLSKLRGCDACLLLAWTEAASFIPQIVAVIYTALDYPNDLATAITFEMLGAIGNALVMAALHYILLFLGYLLLFHRFGAQTQPPRFLHDRMSLASLIFIGPLWLYQLIMQTIEVVDFFNNWQYIYPSEVGMIIFEYIFVSLSIFLGYLLHYITQSLLHYDETREDRLS